jgi:hypothetical protein
MTAEPKKPLCPVCRTPTLEPISDSRMMTPGGRMDSLRLNPNNGRVYAAVRCMKCNLNMEIPVDPKLLDTTLE